MSIRIRTVLLAVTIAAGALLATQSAADSPPVPSQTPALPAPSYADLADLADGAPFAVRAQVRKAVAVEPERARGVRSGWTRLYIEARTEAVLGGTRSLGEQLAYLADVKRDSRGKVPKLKKTSVILFARPVAGRPGELQLVAPDAQLAWSAPLEARVKAVLGELYEPGAPPRIAGVREALHVGGALAGEGETQVFLTSANGEPAALTVSRQPGQPPRFGASFSELVGASDGLPPPETLAWYRLACFLPAQLPVAANIAEGTADRAAAALDYRAVMTQLGPCPRNRE